MKLQDGYMLQEIAGNYVVIPVGQNVIEYKSMLHLNETGAFIWRQLDSNITYQNLLDALITEYEAEEEEKDMIKKDLDEFLSHMKSLNLLISD